MSRTKWKYEKPIYLDHEESLMLVHKRTGEVKELIKPSGKNVGNPNAVKHQPKEVFFKNYPKAWALLETQTTPVEYKIAHKLAMRARAFNNCLIPFNDNESYRKMARILEENHNTFKKVTNKLFKLGVIGKFEVAKRNQEYQKFWIFNPYLSFNGQVIEKGILELFSETYYAKQNS